MFTSEIEMNNSLSFLDIKNITEGNKFTTSVYLRSVVFLLTLRVSYLIRTNTLIFTLLQRALKLFPLSFNDFCLKKYLDDLYVTKEVFCERLKKS